MREMQRRQRWQNEIDTDDVESDGIRLSYQDLHIVSRIFTEILRRMQCIHYARAKYEQEGRGNTKIKYEKLGIWLEMRIIGFYAWNYNIAIVRTRELFTYMNVVIELLYFDIK